MKSLSFNIGTSGFVQYNLPRHPVVSLLQLSWHINRLHVTATALLCSRTFPFSLATSPSHLNLPVECKRHWQGTHICAHKNIFFYADTYYSYVQKARNTRKFHDNWKSNYRKATHERVESRTKGNDLNLILIFLHTLWWNFSIWNTRRTVLTHSKTKQNTSTVTK